MDTLSVEERSERMSRVRARNTKPEMVVRRLLHGLGYRYRLHSSSLPGHPDLVFAGRRKVIFVHGCFWHRHEGCPNCRLPKSKLDFWKPKLEENKLRDKKNQAKLRRQGWRVLVVWECQLKNPNRLKERVVKFLEEPE